MFDREVFFPLAVIGDRAFSAHSCLCEAAVWDCRAQSPAKRCWEDMK